MNYNSTLYVYLSLSVSLSLIPSVNTVWTVFVFFFLEEEAGSFIWSIISQLTQTLPNRFNLHAASNKPGPK